MKYAQIENNVVTNIAEFNGGVPAEFPGIWVPAQGAGIGWAWDGAHFTAPAPTPEPQPARIITRLALRNRFTLSEKAALEFAALDDPSAPTEQRQQAASLRAYMKDLESATYVDLEQPSTQDGVQMLEQAGLIAVGRAAEVLGAPVQDIERP